MDKFEWLVMMFLGGDNDLFQFGKKLLNEVRSVAKNQAGDDVAVVAEIDMPGRQVKNQKYVLLPKPAPNGIPEFVEVERADSQPESIVQFLKQAKKDFPAKRRMFISWDHGNGWQNAHVFEPVQRASDIVRAEEMDAAISRLREGLEEDGVQILGFDACLMSMIEVAYEFRQKVDYIIASQGAVPADRGWPYDAILRTVTLHPKMEASELARTIVDQFGGSYSGSPRSVTLAALDVSAAELVKRKIDVLADALLTALSSDAVVKIEGVQVRLPQAIAVARRYTQPFANPDYVDIVSFAEQLQRLLPQHPEICQAAADVIAAVRKMVVRKTRTNVASITCANGLSIYFPDRLIAPSYAVLDFAKSGKWLEFLTRVPKSLVDPVTRKLKIEPVPQPQPQRQPQPLAKQPPTPSRTILTCLQS